MTVRITQGLVATVDRQAWAGPPTDQLRAQVDRVIKVLEDPDQGVSMVAGLEADRELTIRKASETK